MKTKSIDDDEVSLSKEVIEELGAEKDFSQPKGPFYFLLSETIED